MRHQQLEAWVISVVDGVLAGRALEDDRVELKAQWPATDSRKAARQIAGHANSARGDTILWLIGIDEKERQLTHAGTVEMADWWPQIVRRFDELAPEHTYLAVPVAGGVVHAIAFTTTRAPYVVTTTGGGAEREVPWRSGNSTRSARRSELLRSVIDEVAVPTVTCFDGNAAFKWSVNADGTPQDSDDTEMFGTVRLYIEAAGPCLWPQHLWQATLRVGTHTYDVRKNLSISGPTAGSGTTVRVLRAGEGGAQPAGMIESVPGSGLHIHGSDSVTLRYRQYPAAEPMAAALKMRKKITLDLRFPLANSSRAAQVSLNLHRDPNNPEDLPARDDRGVTFTVRT